MLAEGPEAVAAVARKVREGAAPTYTPHSDRMLKWVAAGLAEVEYVRGEQGGLAAMLAEKGKFDWGESVKIIQGLEQVAAACNEFAAAIRAAQRR